ncbi:MAG TPA: SCP2 sterol-binding domain-containing protein [Baekduia sp.]|nr:SCP2 sterol-binding domain-containing protein [Baekduia sp.]
MPYFTDDTEVYRYIGGVFRAAGEDPATAPAMRSAGVVLRLQLTEPESEITVRFGEPYEVAEGASSIEPDVTLSMPADIADRYWRGDYNLAVGLAKREVKSKGPVNKILKLVPLTKPLFARYRELTADKPQPVAG